MNRYLLDTNIVSELRKPKPHLGVVSWLSQLQVEQMFVSAVTVGELQVGVERARHYDPAKAQEIEVWMDRLIESYSILPMDTLCFRAWGRFMDSKSDSLFEDGMIAATAAVHNLIVATRNERDFLHFDIRITNPFKNT